MKLKEHPQKLLGIILLGLAGLMGVQILFSPREQVLPLVTWYGETMGTTYKVQLTDVRLEDEALDTLTRAVDQELVAVNAAMSTYIPDSEISRFNEGTYTEKSFPVSERFVEVMISSIEIFEDTGGAFDPTLGPLIDLWGFGAKSEEGATPGPEDVARRLEHVGLDKVRLENSALRKRDPEMEINVSAIAKGYAVDRVHQLLQDEGFANIYVEIGGEVVCTGVNASGGPWRLGIQFPERDASASLIRVVALDNRALATSGDYRNYMEDPGLNRHHIIDPRTGYPAEHSLASVSVLADTCMVADAVATALYVMGTEEGMEWLAARPDIEAYFIDRQEDGFHFTATPGFEAALIAVP